jgi:SAM-dependent methyltransferase
MDCTQPGFWEERYLANRVPWDAGGVPDALREYLRGRPAGGRVLIPGCGSGHEVAAFAAAGWDVTAVDFSPAAVARARAVLGAGGDCVKQADFFAGDLGAGYDLIYERTFLCSLPPGRWPDYARRMAALLRPGGIIVGIFFYGNDPEPPPFPLTAAAAKALFSPVFALLEDRPIPADQSLPLYAGAERWQVWRKSD